MCGVLRFQRRFHTLLTSPKSTATRSSLSTPWDMDTQKALFPLDFIPWSELPYVTLTSQTLFSISHMKFALSPGGPKAGPSVTGPSAWPEAF